MKTISREAIQRMTNSTGIGGIGRGGDGGTVAGGGADLTGYATQTWVDENYLSIAFFRNLFRAYESDNTTEVLPNSEGTTIDNIKAMFGFWTDQYLSALGQNSSGGGGGGGSSTLAGLNDVQLGTLDANDVLTYDGSGHWVNTPKATLLSGYATQSWVTGTALSGYATQSWVQQTALAGFATQNWVMNNALIGYATQTWVIQQGFLTSVAFSDLTSHPTTLSGYGITDAVKNNTTWWGQSVSNGAVIGNMTGVGSIEMSALLYMANGQSLQFKDSGGTYRNVLTVNSLNQLAIGYHIRQQGYTTDIQGGNITFGVGTTRVEAFEIVSTGQCYVKQGTQGLRIGDGVILWDSTNNAMKVQKNDGTSANFYATGGVSALGMSAGTSSIDAMTFNYVTINNQMSIKGSGFLHQIYGDSDGNLVINGSEFILFGNDINTNGYNIYMNGGDIYARRFYLDRTRYIYLDNGTLKFYDGTTSKTVVLS